MRRFCLTLACVALVSGPNALPLAVAAQTAPPPIGIQLDGPTAFPALGHGSIPLHVHITDSEGKSFAGDERVRAEILRGDARFDSAISSASASIDVKTDDDGSILLNLLPGTRAGQLAIRIEAAGGEFAELDLMLTSVARPPLVVGYATGGIGPVPGWIEAPDGAPNGTNTRRGAISVYGTGEISKNTRGTFAYNSADTLAQSLTTGPFLDNPNDRPFPIYGDTSTRYDDALSLNRFYGRIENGFSSATWGEFYAHAAPTYAAGGYTMLINGARVHAEGNKLGASVFTARNDIAYGRQIITPTGLAISSQLLQPSIVVGSDILTLVSLDKRSGAVLSQQTLVRDSDYVIDYASGLLRFINILLPYDDAFNPQVVQVQYEYGGPAARSNFMGGDSSLKLGNAGRLDAWYLNNAFGSGNLSIFGQSIGGGTPSTTWSASHEHSNGFVPTTLVPYGNNGDSYRVALDTHTDKLHVKLAYASTSAAYDNPYGTYTSPGLESITGVAVFKLGGITALELSYVHAQNQLPATSLGAAVNNSDSSGALTLRVKPSPRFRYHLGVRADSASSNGVVNPTLLPSDSAQQNGQFFTGGQFLQLFSPVQYQAGQGHSIDADYGFDWRFTPHASFGVDRLSALGNAGFDPYDPPQTSAELTVDVGPKAKAFIRQLWQQAQSPVLSASQTVQSSVATATSSTSVGFEQQVGHATIQTGYAVDHTANGTDLYDAFGVRTSIVKSERFNVDAFGQIGQSLYANYGSPANAGRYFYTGGTSLDYSYRELHATGQVQARTGFDSGSTFLLGVAGPISPAVSLFGSASGAFTSSVQNNEERIGLSYRPSRNDRYVTLFTVDALKSNLVNYNAYVTNVAQIQELYRPSRRTEFAGSLAYKLTGDAYFAPRTSIWGLRGDQRIGSRLDIGSEVHWSNTAPIQGTSATGLAVEAGYRVGSTFRVGAGYNFSGFTDPATAVSPTHRGVYFTLSSYIDRIFGWGKDHTP